MYFLWKKSNKSRIHKKPPITSQNNIAPHNGEATADATAPHRETVFFLTEKTNNLTFNTVPIWGSIFLCNSGVRTYYAHNLQTKAQA